jgi:hypothetical protein
MMRPATIRAFAALGVTLICAPAITPAMAQDGGSCGQAAFASAVSESGGILSTMNDQKRKAFMEKLQALKAQEKWSDADYGVKAKIYVQDEKILGYDAKGKALLEKVQALGGGDALTDDKRCVMLRDLKILLGDVVKNTREKWDYMFAKLSSALKPATAATKPHTPNAATAAATPKPAPKP